MSNGEMIAFSSIHATSENKYSCSMSSIEFSYMYNHQDMFFKLYKAYIGENFPTCHRYRNKYNEFMFDGDVDLEMKKMHKNVKNILKYEKDKRVMWLKRYIKDIIRRLESGYSVFYVIKKDIEIKSDVGEDIECKIFDFENLYTIDFEENTQPQLDNLTRYLNRRAYTNMAVPFGHSHFF